MAKIINTVIQQHGDISSVPLEVFGEGEVILKIGYVRPSRHRMSLEIQLTLYFNRNGGAGTHI